MRCLTAFKTELIRIEGKLSSVEGSEGITFDLKLRTFSLSSYISQAATCDWVMVGMRNSGYFGVLSYSKI